MKKLKGSAAAKWAAAILFALAAVLAVFCAAGTAYLYDGGVSRGATEDDMLKDVASTWGYEQTANTLNMLESMGSSLYDPELGEIYGGYLVAWNENEPAFCFVLLDENGDTVFDGLQDREFIWTSGAREFSYTAQVAQDQSATAVMPAPSATPEPTAAPEATGAPESAEAVTSPEPTGEDETTVTVTITESVTKKYSLIGYVLKDIPESSGLYEKTSFVSFLYLNRDAMIIGLAGGLTACALLFWFLMASAGHKNGAEGIKGGVFEKLPFDLFTVAIIVIAGVICAIITNVSYLASLKFKLTGYAAFGAVLALVCLWWCVSLAIRIKQKTLIKGCVCFKLLAWLWRVLKAGFGLLKRTIEGLPLVGKGALIIAGILFVEFIYSFIICEWSTAGRLFGWFVERGALTVLALYALICMKKLLVAGKEIAAGNMDYTVDETNMYGPLREHAESLNHITAGLNRAVAERMKSERFRTELITNVSHDIKTPLTSIISYVDLMEKEQPESEKMREYLGVLARQSARLKKLIDDLMEASKASSGALSVTLERCELGVLIDQCAGDYEEKLAAKGLELIVSKCEEGAAVMADGRHMWRIFDNLLNNICKYAQSGTRVYIDLERRECRAVVTFRNISASRLNIGGDELMERFVRGDLSRNTEGSGLGLSIAQSLTKLQGGEMRLTVDGDLFKVELGFALIRE